MKLNIRGEKLEITDSMKNYASEKLERLSKYLDKGYDATANLLFKLRGPKHKIEVTIPLKNFTLRVEEEGNDFYAIVDTAIDKLERQIRKNKTRMSNKKNKTKTEYNFDYDAIEPLEDEENEAIVKRKTVELKPMDEEEAILQMELLGHSFYIFKDIETNKVAILYKRKDNNYGLIEEE